jgi:hypothetical protein
MKLALYQKSGGKFIRVTLFGTFDNLVDWR